MFIPRGNKTRKERINKQPEKIYPFAACALSLQDDINLNLIFRSLCNFPGNEMFIVGSKQWHKGATNGLEEFIKLTYFKDFHEFLEYSKETDYELVAIEQSNDSILLTDFEHPKKPCYIFGAETGGLTNDVLFNCESIVEIPMQGYHPCLNVGVSAGIIFYDFVRQTINNEKSYNLMPTL